MELPKFVEKLKTELDASGATPQLLAFALSNAGLLQSLGTDTLKTIMDLIDKGQLDEAQKLMDLQMTPDQIIVRENMNAQELAADTARREKFLAELKQFGLALLPVLIKIGIGIATGGTAI